MSSFFSQWIHEHRSRIDEALISLLSDKWKFLHHIPSFLHIPAAKTLYKWTNIPILVQWESNTFQHFTHQMHPLYELGLPIQNFFQGIHTCSLPVSLSQLQTIIQIPGIKKVFLDREVSILLETGVPTVKASLIWPTGNEGQDATIAVIDTGIAPHPDLKSRIIGFHDIIRHKKQAYDDNGHGTHCAGCAAGDGTQSNGKYRGVAPKASLIGVKVLNKYGIGTLSTVIAGIEWCIKHKEEYQIDIISLSLGSSATSPYTEDPVCQMVELAWKAGIVVVVAAGNEGPNPKTIASPGNNPHIITVGATDDQKTVDFSDDQIAYFSSRGPTLDGLAKPDLVAPGTNIVSLRSRSSFLDTSMKQNRVDKHYFRLSGTSMATPIVAGVAALMLTSSPNLSPDQVKDRMMKTACSLQQSPTEQGVGLINAEQANL
jgi:serine protease AprX